MEQSKSGMWIGKTTHSIADLKPGDRVQLVRTDDPYTKLEPGELGTISPLGVTRGVCQEPVVNVNWDCGSNLSLLPLAGDHFVKLEG